MTPTEAVAEAIAVGGRKHKAFVGDLTHWAGYGWSIGVDGDVDIDDFLTALKERGYTVTQVE